MAQKISVEAVVTEKTYIGKVRFPVSVPQGLVDLLRLPDDVNTHAKELGLDETALKFLFAALRGKWGLRADVNLQNLAIKTGMQYADMDAVIRDLIAKNYARLGDRLDLYRFWIVLLHAKGIRFVAE